MAWAEDDWERTVPPVDLDPAELDHLLGDLGPATRVTPLTAGKANTNLRVDRAAGPPLVVRIYQRDPDAFERERRLWALVEGLVPVPALRAWGRTAAGVPVAVVDHVDGRHPAQLMAADPASAGAVGEALGQALARLTEVPIPGLGLYAPDLSLARRFDSVAHSFVDLIEWSLDRGRARRRLGRERVAALRRALPAAVAALGPLEDHPGLAHGDYKSSNLLLRPRGGAVEVAAVLDWEFACPFTPMLDVAILLRHRDTVPPAFQEGFAAAYRGTAWLPDDWRRVSRVVDLMNLVGFLNASGDRPRLYTDVLRLVDHTVAGL